MIAFSKRRRLAIAAVGSLIFCSGITATHAAVNSPALVDPLIAPVGSTAQEAAQLGAAIAAANSTPLAGEDPGLADDVDYWTERGQSLLADPDATPDQLNVAELRIQVALDALEVELQTTTIPELQALVRAGSLTYERLMGFYLHRIELYDLNTVALKSVRALNPRALEIARAKDAEVRANPDKAKGIFGMPVMVKDNVGTIGTDGMPTTAGSVALAQSYYPTDSFIAKRIKDAGAIMFGKLNLSEFANYISTAGMPSGYSSLAGQVFNPYKQTLNANGAPVLSPSGSSSGSGAASAAALAAVTIGTETSGSILSPTQANSIAGVKPTVGLVSRTGIVPLSSSQDTAGPMGRTVADIAELLTIVSGWDTADPITHDSVGRVQDYARYLQRGSLRGARLGLIGNPSAVQAGAYSTAVAALTALGATVVTTASGGALPYAPDYSSNNGGTGSIVLNYDFKKDLTEYLATLAPDYPIKNMADLIAYNDAHPETVKYGQGLILQAYARDLDAQRPTFERDRANDLLNSRDRGIDWTLDHYDLDALITVSGSTTGIAAKAGYPTVSVPVGYNSNPPQSNSWGAVNLGFTGTAYSEAQLISFAYDFEQATHSRIPPGMAVKDDLRAILAAAPADPFADDVAALDILLAAATERVNSTFSTQKDVDRAAAAITDGLAVAELADQADAMVGALDGYSAASVARFSAALREAKAALISRSASGARFAAARAGLAGAIAGLEPDAPEPTPTVSVPGATPTP
ncbi:MAG: hypothetical protein LBT54_03725, partial [Bifidobacteriaceae bacterium]|nr:hypothetical protein [Bifidobacteriaceae bacterium]